MARIGGKNTQPERIVRSLLHRLGYRFRLHRKDLPGKPDIVLPKYKAVIFVHGCFWHGHTCSRGKLPASNAEFWQRKIAGNVHRDQNVVTQLNQAGWRVILVWQCQLKHITNLERRFKAVLSCQTGKAQGRK